ncbi:hypothetical protein CELD12_08480 [Cellulomonas sp. NTE-D12]|nr:hypothetical protein CELD12_08480 [Cellulomonas sp. NTE-D12]
MADGAHEVSAVGAAADHTSEVPCVPLARRTSDHVRPQPETEATDWVPALGPSAATSSTICDAADGDTAAAAIADDGLVVVRALVASTFIEVLDATAVVVDGAAAASWAPPTVPTPTTASAVAAAACATARLGAEAKRRAAGVRTARAVRRRTARVTLRSEYMGKSCPSVVTSRSVDVAGTARHGRVGSPVRVTVRKAIHPFGPTPP